MASNYNGYSNYATWRVQNDILGKYTFTEPVEACDLETIVSAEIFDGTELGFIADFAAAFVNQADFEELAYTINKDFE
jgi:hypothetical protein